MSLAIVLSYWEDLIFVCAPQLILWLYLFR